MTLPTYEEIMLPLLNYLSDNEERTYSETTEYLAKSFNLDKNDLEKEKSSGGNLFYNRIGWAKDYLTKAKLLEKKTGKFHITPRGLDVLEEKPLKINKKFLMKFSEFIPYVSSNKDTKIGQEENLEEQSPDDLIDIGFGQINNILKTDLLEKLKTVYPTFFEKLVLELVEKIGYGKGRHTGRTGDKGIDGEITQDELGLDMIYLQVKRYNSNVPSQDIRNFAGALSLKKARRGIFITTANFNADAYDDIKESDKNIVLINGEKLVELMIKNNVGIRIKKSFHIKEIIKEYFED